MGKQQLTTAVGLLEGIRPDVTSELKSATPKRKRPEMETPPSSPDETEEKKNRTSSPSPKKDIPSPSITVDSPTQVRVDHNMSPPGAKNNTSPGKINSPQGSPTSFRRRQPSHFAPCNVSEIGNGK